MVSLTPRQRDIFAYLKDYIETYQLAPTYDEIGAEFGINKVTVLAHLKQLEIKGLIRRVPYAARGIELCDEREQVIPVAGVIQAGQPITAIEDVEELNLKDLLAMDDDLFALRVKGESMIGDNIEEGDYVLVKKDGQPRRGDVVVALIDQDEATLKRYYPEGIKIRLQPSNPEFTPIVVERERVTLQGRVVGIFRMY